jgi:3,4-dihydroxy 2-butanone 4-phosphate synthase/GTP cyclohydrolase II
LVRVHSECFTGDVLGSRRCDCGEQLHAAMQLIAKEGRGIIVYLRQEGRGIGLRKKLEAYNLQDQGHDTVDANLLLGHQADERTYWAAVGILQELAVRSIRLLTNNPNKIDQLHEAGLRITGRVPIEPTIHAENVTYLTTKVQRMRHLLQLNGSSTLLSLTTLPNPAIKLVDDLSQQSADFYARYKIPLVTVSYAQSIDGSMAATNGAPLRIGSERSMGFTHLLRATHEAILVGIGTVLADNPRLTVRLAPGHDPQPVVLDNSLRTPPTACCITGPRPAWIATTRPDAAREQALRAAGARIGRLPSDQQGQVDLVALLEWLGSQGVRSLMVEGGARVLRSFLQSRLVNQVVVTIAPLFIGGLRTVPDLMTDASHQGAFPRLHNPQSFTLDDIMLHGALPHAFCDHVARP